MKTLNRSMAVALALMLAAAACSGSDEDAAVTDETAEETSGDSGGDAMEDDAAPVPEFVPEFVPPTDIGPQVPLDSVPEPKTIAWLECSLPSCQAITVGFEEAVPALGWELEVISFSTDAAAAFQQALDQGVDYVALTGTPQALIQDQLDQAAEQGVAFFSCYDTSPAEEEVNNIWLQCGSDVYPAGYRIAQTIIEDSGGDANVMMVNIPDFAALVREREGSEAAYEQLCPDCVFTELALTLDQLLAGEVPGAVVSALQADPDVDYLHIAFDGLAGGLTPTLAEAEMLDSVRIAGVDFSGVILEEIVAGTMFAWTANPKEYAAWMMVDGMARHSIGQENTEVDDAATLPTFIVNSAETAEPLIAGNGWPGPDTMAEQFFALWGV